MHGWEIGSGSRKTIRHMRPVSTSTGGVAAAVDDSGGVVTCSSSPSSFFKDVRKISVGDCALFKPQKDSPPSIGIIRSLESDKENNLQLGVNWLYRPTDVKLLKGISPEAAPNEVFYSFRRDEIPAASLLHPCKVAFLPSGVELPSGISSFVCRRVYDTANKRLWWLTDQDYIDDRQEEVDKLLRKTQTEMHATVQQQHGGRSPKPVNSPMSTSQLKQSPDSVQNSTTVFPSQTKGKKRERIDQAAEPVKRERSSKADDGGSGVLRSEGTLKPEIAKFTEKGGLVDSEGVERLVHLMQPDKSERKMDLACRSLLASVIAATDKVDFLNQFVQLRGLCVLDDWLQEAHKGKIGDSSSPRDQDRSVEDFLLVLLRALDRLPVNLNALQMCNIGKSVNHLRSHRNSEIQKKARSLVDTWKKRVEAEMNINDTRSGTNQAVSWTARTRNEVSQVTNRHPSGSDAAMKNSISQLSSSKSAPVKLVQGEAVAKSPSASASPGNVKLASSPGSTSASLRDGHLRTSVITGSSELPQSAARDEKSSGSSHSHTNSQCSSDHAKNVGPSVKEDARSSNSGSTSLNKSSGSGSRHRKTANGLQVPAVTAHQKEDGTSRNSSLTRISVSEKLSQLPVKCEKNTDAPISDSNNHKLIVKISNRGRSPAQSVNGGSVEDPSSTNSRASSPVNPDKHGQLDHHLKEKNDGFPNCTPSDVNTESWQSNDLKDGVNGCDEGDGSPATAPDLGRCTTGDEVGKSTSDVKSLLSTKIEAKSRKSLDSSLSSMNALIESCVKYSEANAAIAAGDDVGMNLLASVAAGEISKSGVASPAHSPQRSTSTADESCRDYSSRSKTDLDSSVGDQSRLNSSVHTEPQKQSVPSSVSPAHNDDQGDRVKMSGKDSSHNMETCSKTDKKYGESGAAVSVSLGATCAGGGEGAEKVYESKAGVKDKTNVHTSSRRECSNSSLATEDKLNYVSVKERIRIKHAETTSVSSTEAVDKKNDVKVGPKSNTLIEQTPAVGVFESTARNEKPAVPTSIVNNLLPGQLNDLKTDDLDVDCGKLHDQGANQKIEQEKTASLASPKQEHVFDIGVANKKTKGNEEDLVKKESVSGSASKICSPAPAAQDKEISSDAKISIFVPKQEHVFDIGVANKKTKGNEEDLVKKESASGSASKIRSPAPAAQDKEICSDAKISILASGEGEETEEGPSVHATSPVAGSSGLDGKLGFDLNEGFDVDDCKDGDPPGMTAPGCISSVCLVSPLPSHSAASTSMGLPASITVAAAAKGPFVPPEDLLRSKGELKWKGSAATSAFRPAEPRKFPEMPSSTNNAIAPDVSKQGRTVFDIDLNVADDLGMEETSCQNMELRSGKRDECSANNGPTGSASGRCAGGLDLDLNRVDEDLEVGQPPSQGLRFDSTLQQAKFSSSTLSNNDSGRRDFDLNNGPAADEVAVESSAFNQHGRMNIPAQPSVGFRISNAELGNLNSWYSAGSTFSALPISASLPDREQPYPVVGTGGVPARMLGGPTGTMPFNPDMYRGSVLSSSPAVPFPAAPFQYPVFPFGSSFPLPSSSLSGGSAAFVDPTSGGRLCIPAVPSQLVGNAPNISTQYPRPYFVSLSDVSSSVAGDTAQKWGRQGLDLNAGPGASDAEGRDETLAIPPRQVPNIGSLALADEQSRMLYPMAGGVLKRKEPDGGWDSDRLSYKQHSWQ